MSEGSAATEAVVSCNPVRKLCQVCGLLVGALLVIALIAYTAIAPVYEARSEFTLGGSSRPPIDDGNGVGMFSGSYEEIFSTRLSMWRSEKIVAKIVQLYRASFPKSKTTDQEILEALSTSGLELIRHSRLIAITVRSTSPQLAAALANAYAEAIKVATDEENKDRCDHAVREIVERVQKQRRVDEDVARRLMNFRSENNIDAMRARRIDLEAKVQKNISEMLKLQNDIVVANENRAKLHGMQLKPKTFDMVLTSGVFPDELRKAGESLRKVELEMSQLLSTHQKDNPAVKTKERELQLSQATFNTAVSNELDKTENNLGALKKQLQALEKSGEQYRREMTQLSQNIVAADAGLKQLEKEMEVSTAMLKDLMQRENEARICCERDNEMVTVLKRAEVPTLPANFIPKLFWILTGGRCYAK